MRVAIFQPYYRGWGGTERVVTDLGRYLPHEGINPIVIVPGTGLLTDLLKELDVPFRVVEAPPVLNLFGGQYYSFGGKEATSFGVALVRYNWHLAALLKAQKADLVILNGIRAAVIAGLAPRLARIPSVLYIHGYFHGVEHARFERIVHMWMALCPDFFIAVSQASLRDFLHGLPRPQQRRVEARSVIVYNWTSVRKTTSVTDREVHVPPRLGTLANIERRKGIHCLLEVAYLLRERGLSFKMLVAGRVTDQAYFDELIATAKRLGLREWVEFRGFVDSETFLKNLDVFLLASDREGMPLAVLEAMSHGLPIVAFRASGVDEALNFGEAGVLVTVGDVKAMAEAVATLLMDDKARVHWGKRALERSSAFNPATQISRLAADLRRFASMRRRHARAPGEMGPIEGEHS